MTPLKTYLFIVMLVIASVSTLSVYNVSSVNILSNIGAGILFIAACYIVYTEKQKGNIKMEKTMNGRREACVWFAIGLLFVTIASYFVVSLGDFQCICVLAMGMILTTLVYSSYMDDRDTIAAKQYL
jgi:fucose 4-O-acetylase-like acetyltransferase